MVIKDAYRLYESTPDDIHPKHMLEEFAPLTKGQYPIFDKYPKFVVDYLVSLSFKFLGFIISVMVVLTDRSSCFDFIVPFILLSKDVIVFLQYR